MWRVQFAAPAVAAFAFAEAIEPLAVMVSVFDADERVRAGKEPLSWAAEIWLGDQCIVEAMFDEEPAAGSIDTALRIASASTGAALPPIVVEAVEEEDWAARTNVVEAPIEAGRFRISGMAGFDIDEIDAPAIPSGRTDVRIVATTAFGTGRHETTLGCLKALDALLKRTRPRRALDLGTGSGVLSLALAKATPAAILATDIDPRAVDATRANATANGLVHRLRPVVATGYRHAAVARAAPYDLVLANVLARPLMRLAPDLARHLRPGGHAILSGLLVHQEPAVLMAHRRQGLSLVARRRIGDWSTLLLRR